MLREFKAFALRGNVVDMAVGIIIGGAFGKIVSSLVNDILMPPIGVLLGRVDFSNLFLSLTGAQYESLGAAKEAGAATINYGLFINTVLDFVLIALAMFLLIRQMNRMAPKPQPAAKPATKECPYCLSTIPLMATRCPHCTSQLGAS